MGRVLLVGRGAPERGGIPTYLHTLLASELEQRHDLSLLNQSHGDVPAAGRLTGGNLGRLVRDAIHLWRAAAGQDVVHLHSALAPAVTIARAGLLCWVARRRGCRVILHAHGGLLLLWLTTPRRVRFVRAVLAPAHRVLAVSAALQGTLEQAIGRRVDLVENGVDTDEFAPGPPSKHSPPRVLYVGALTPRKGVLDLLEASRLLTARSVPHELHLVGGTPSEGGPAEEQVRAAVQGSGAHLLGDRQREQMPDVYRAADVLCLASWYEAMPLSVLEALASGLPVVATEVGDVARVVRPGDTGALVSARDPEGLAAALEPILLDADLRRRLGGNGRRTVMQHFASSETARSIDRIYVEEVGRGR